MPSDEHLWPRPTPLTHGTTAAGTPGEPATEVTSAGVDFRVPGTSGVRGIRLEVDFPLGDTDPEFARSPAGDWSMHLPRPAVDRLEYQFTVRSGSITEWTTDPGNPATVPNPFGDKSELRFPEYREPSWLDSPMTGGTQSIQTPAGALHCPVPVTLWAPDGLGPQVAAPLLLANDGSDMADRGSLLRWAGWAAGGRPFRVALLDPPVGQRDRWYAADETYADHLADVVLPAIRGQVAVGATIGLGASLGALAMLHAHRRHRGLLDALALQSGSFFTSGLDPQESGWEPFARICAAVEKLAAGPAVETVPVLITCGTVEENWANNRQMAASLAAQGYQVKVRPVRDAHTMVGWRDAWSPGLEQMLDAVSSVAGSSSRAPVTPGREGEDRSR